MGDSEPKASEPNGGSGPQLPPDATIWRPLAIGFFHVISRFADRFGVPMTILLLLFGAVRFLGTAQTQDDFIRELFFGTVTNTRYLGVFFALLILFSIAGAQGLIERKGSESREMKRMADEKRELQQRLLARELSRTSEPSVSKLERGE